MRLRRHSLALVVAAALLIGLPAPRASARGAYTITISGTVTLAAGIDSSCSMVIRHLPAPPPTSTKTCPAQVTPSAGVTIVPFPPQPNTTPTITIGPTPPNKKSGWLWRTNGNTTTGTFAATVCAGSGQHIAKKQPIHAGPCTASASLGFTGYCDVFYGTASGRVRDDLGQNIWSNLTYSGIAGTVIVRGNWWKGPQTKPADLSTVEHGDVHGVLHAAPAGGPTENCVDKTAKTFTLTGAISFLHPKLLA